MRNLVVLDDTVIRQLLVRRDVVDLFPQCLRRAAKSRTRVKIRSCSRCSKQRASAINFAQIRRCFATLSAENRQALKRILDADKVRINFSKGRNRRMQLTF